MTERVSCLTVGCNGTILPSTAEKTDGYCMPCYQKMKRKEQAEWIEKNRVEIDPYADTSDPVELIKIKHTPRPYDPLVNYVKCQHSTAELYAKLSSQDVDELKSYVLALMDTADDDDMGRAQDLLLEIVCFTNSNIDECLEVLLKNDEYFPGILFKNSSSRIRDQLIQQIDPEHINNILIALAWIGDQTVVDLFAQWRKKSPKWKKRLFVAPEDYSLEAGWELTDDRKRRDLYYRTCYPLEKQKPSHVEAVCLLMEYEQYCQWCGNPSTVLFDFDLLHPSLQFLNLGGQRLKIVTCPLCTCYSVIYTTVDFNGTATWSEWNKKPDYLPEFTPEDRISVKIPIRISSQTRDCYYGANQFLDISFSQVGGHPTWIQDAEYPECPKCGQRMKFIGQIDWADIEEYGEGIYYAFICKECRIAATIYQQS